ncbi:MAG: hypothetical protein OXG18_01465 [Gemmatimonadetes bacterium]|nr:hypothetical protein [Gemmatimonadota bacterium]
MTSAGSCSTVTAASPDAVSALAVIVARPFPAAVTKPVASTVAIALAPDDHLTATPVIGSPFWSVTVAVNLTVSPNAARSAEEGDTDTTVGTGAGSSQPATKATATAATMALGKRIVSLLLGASSTFISV